MTTAHCLSAKEPGDLATDAPTLEASQLHQDDIVLKVDAGSGTQRRQGLVACVRFAIAATSAVPGRKGGARAALPSLSKSDTPLGRWLKAMIERGVHRNSVVVALANKLARIAWAILRKLNHL